MGLDLSDRDLIERVGADAAAFEELYRRHVRQITTYAATRCRRPEDVADLVTTTFVAAIESAARYDPARGEVLPWLLGIARHLSSDSARHPQREREALAKVAGWRWLLARIPHLVNRGTVTDRAGRHGVAVSLDTGEFGGGVRETLILDPRTGQLLSFEETLIREAKADQFPIGAVLAYTDILSSGYVNNLTSTP